MKKFFMNIKTTVFNFMGRFWDNIKVDSNERRSAERMLEKIRPMSLMDCEIYLKENKFRWSKDPVNGFFDYVSEPWYTLLKKRGDCDDFAALWVALCNEYKCVQFSVHTSDISHRMVCFRYENDYYIASNIDMALHIVTDDVNIKKRFGDINTFEAAVIAAANILYSPTKIKSIVIRDEKGYAVDVFNVVANVTS